MVRPEEEDIDIKLKDAVQTHGGNNWGAIATLVQGGRQKQCTSRWYGVLDPSIDRANVRTGNWEKDEDIKLKDAVQAHGGKNWGAIAALVPGRTMNQCSSRWHKAVDPSIDRTIERMGPWAEDEDFKLKDAVETHGGKNWGAIATLVPGRGERQCYHRWKDVLDPSMNREIGRTGKWTEDENSKLKDAVQTRGGKNWDAIGTLVPGRCTRAG
jgi:hypothetical protein